MVATNIIGPIDEETWRALRNARGALSVFSKDKAKYKAAILKYTDIYQDTLREAI